MRLMVSLGDLLPIFAKLASCFRNYYSRRIGSKRPRGTSPYLLVQQYRGILLMTSVQPILFSVVRLRESVLIPGSSILIGLPAVLFIFVCADITSSHQLAQLREESRTAADRLEESEAVQKVHAGKVIDLKREVRGDRWAGSATEN